MTNPFKPHARSERRIASLALPDLGVVPAGKSSPPKAEMPVDERADPLGSRGRQSNELPEYCVPRALAKRWHVCVDKVLRFIQTGELRAFNVASQESRRPRYRISMEEVRRFEEQTRSAAPPQAEKSLPSRRRKSPPAGQSPRSYF
ncbi:MAG: hypothetical protein WCQ77_12080 [Planctomycetota bacterium]